MKVYLSKICLILAVVFTSYASISVACFDCESLQIEQKKMSVETYCQDEEHSGDEKSSENKLDCCCFDSPIKNADTIQIHFIPQVVAVLDLIDDSIEPIQTKPILNLSLKRYHPFSPLSSANLLALKQSFLI